MRVAMFSNLFAPIVGGSATQIQGLCLALSRQGHHALVVTSRIDPAWPEEELIDGYRVVRVPALRLPQVALSLHHPFLNATLSPGNLQRAVRLLRDFRADVVHVHNHMLDMAFLGIAAARRLDLPVVLTVHTPIRHTNRTYDRVLTTLDRHLLGPGVVRRAAGVVCPDAEVARYVRDTFGEVPAHIIPYGIDDLSQSSPAEVAAVRTTHGLSEGDDVILSLGHCHDLRDRRELIAAMPGILSQRPRARLLIIGDMMTKRPLRQCAELGLGKSVLFTGSVSRVALPSYLALGQVESHWLTNQAPERQSLGVASLEAMLAGKVVIAAASAAAYGEGILQYGTHFLFVQPGRPDSLAELILSMWDDTNRAQKIGRSARQVMLRHFAWSEVCERTVALYEQVRQGQG